MKIKWLIIPLALLLFITTGCEDNDEFEPVGYSGNMSESAQLLSFSDNEFVTTYDIALVYENHSYLMKLNASANVLAVAVDTTFDDALLPIIGYMTDTTGYYVIGGNWQDGSTYNPVDHSIQSNGTTYFIRTTAYRWIKLEVLSGSPSSMTFKYMLVDGDGTVETVTVDYTEDTPVYYNFTNSAELTPDPWDMGFVITPVYNPGDGQNYNMTTVLTNFSEGVEVAVITDQLYSDVSSAPANVEWLFDTATNHILGYGAEFEVMTYHHELYQVLIDHSEYVYLVKSGSNIFKIQFKGFDDWVIVFDFAKL